LTGFALHVVQRGNNRGACFITDADRQTYLAALREAALHYRMQVHAYVLMSNHVHLLTTPLVVNAVSRAMQSVGARYVRHFNQAHTRTGTLWEGRYKACLVYGSESFRTRIASLTARPTLRCSPGRAPRDR
jgi:putative transposase